MNSRVFPLYEIENGEKYRFTVEPRGTPVADYVRPQGRFAHLNDDAVQSMQQQTDARWRRLMRIIEKGN
ncbi:MAG: hypothetical protein ABIH66_05885 [bacterium]